MEFTDDIIIYHNGECSKSLGALEVLQERGVPHTVRWYMADPLSVDELRLLISKLGVPPSHLARVSEPLYAEKCGSKKITETEWLQILAANPVLIQRPIVEKGGKAVIARPAERLSEILNV